jgi:hypothetical protein
MDDLDLEPQYRNPATTHMTITIQSNGYLAINRLSWNALGQPSYVRVLFDKQRRIIALQAAETLTDQTYPVMSRTGIKRFMPGLICAAGLCRTHNLPKNIKMKATFARGHLFAKLPEVA